MIHFGAVCVDAFEALRGDYVGTFAENAELSFDGADGHHAVAAQRCKELLFQHLVEIFRCSDAVNQSHIQRIVGCDGCGQEEHFAGFVDTQLVDEMKDA